MTVMCVYQDCLSVKNPCSRIAFFRLPNDERRSIWIRNSGNKSLFKIGEKAHRFFCEKHFLECDISSQFNRKLLKKHAVPVEHSSLEAPTLDLEAIAMELEESNMYFDGSIELTDENKKLDDTETVIELRLDDGSVNQCKYEEPIMHNTPTNDTSEENDDKEGASYSQLEFYDEYVDADTEIVLDENQIEDQTEKKEKLQQDVFSEIFYDKVDSSTLEHEMKSESERIQSPDDELDEFREPYTVAKKQRLNELESPSRTKNVQVTTLNKSYQEDKHFALSLVGYFQRLPQEKKALAKLKILQYLTELELDLPHSL